jgi:nucleoside-diphosphate-sugar epimerase
VTGGLGFIGHHLCDSLLRHGAEVVIVDDQSASVVPSEWFRGRARVVLTSVRSYQIDADFDWVCHLAGPVGPTRVMSARGTVGSAIVDSMRWLLDNVVPTRSRALYVSTSEVYGVARPVKEDDNLTVIFPYSGRREYSCGKLLAEVMLINAARALNKRPLIIRPFNVAGPRQSDRGGFVLPRFALAVLAERPMTVYGTGRQRRCFTHVHDLVDAIVQLMVAGESGIFNVGNTNNNVSIMELAERFSAMASRLGVGRACGVRMVDPQVLHGPEYEEAPDKIPDLGRLRTAIDWSPKYDIDMIMQDVLQNVESLAWIQE